MPSQLADRAETIPLEPNSLELTFLRVRVAFVTFTFTKFEADSGVAHVNSFVNFVNSLRLRRKFPESVQH